MRRFTSGDAGPPSLARHTPGGAFLSRAGITRCLQRSDMSPQPIDFHQAIATYLAHGVETVFSLTHRLLGVVLAPAHDREHVHEPGQLLARSLDRVELAHGLGSSARSRLLSSCHRSALTAAAKCNSLSRAISI